MFTASIIKKNFSEGVMQVVVEFTNGVETVTKAFNITSEPDLKNQVRNETTRLTALSAFSKTLAEGVYDTTDATNEPPTQEVIEKREWFRNFNKLERLTKLQELGALRPNAVAALDTLKATVAADFKQAYIADM